jgi:hypothetical protein
MYSCLWYWAAACRQGIDEVARFGRAIGTVVSQTLLEIASTVFLQDCVLSVHGWVG